MVSREVRGMCLISLSALSNMLTVISVQITKIIEIPYFKLIGSALLTLSLGLALVIKAGNEGLRVKRSQWIWVWARGFFGTCVRTLTLMAIAYGAPVGECTALQSINVVVAALWGRMFLGEPIRWLHGIALLCAVVGAFLVSKPDVLLGLSDAEGRVPWLGYILSLLAGTFAGALFIATRKSQGLSPSLLNWSLTVQQGVVLWLVSLTGFVEDAPLSSIEAKPVQASLVFACLLVLLLVTIWGFSTGAQLCPASSGSTIYTSVHMGLGFMAQTLLQNKAPDMLPLAGAALLLFAVILMSFSRWLYLDAPSPPSIKRAVSEESVGSEQTGETTSEMTSEMPKEVPSVKDEAEGADDEVDSVGSLASYVASEFSGISCLPITGARQRRAPPAAVAAPAQILGAVASA